MDLCRISYISIRNFLSIGDTPVVINFSEHNNIIHVKGKNGAGKTTIFLALFYGLFGKVLKNINQEEIINRIVKKNLEIIIHFDNYRVIRTRKPNALKFFKDNEELTLSGMPLTQELINNALKLHYESFVNLSYFGQHNYYTFLNCDPSTKRKIVENILSLEKYNKYAEVAKKKKKLIEDDVKYHLRELELHQFQSEESLKQIQSTRMQSQNWELEKERTLNDLIVRKKNCKVDDILKCEKAQVEFEKQKENAQLAYDVLFEKISIINNLSLELFSKISELKNNYINLHNKQNESKDRKSKISRLESGVICDHCFGTVSIDNYKHILDKEDENIQNLSIEMNKIKTAMLPLQEEYKGLLDEIKLLNGSVKEEQDNKIRAQEKLRKVLEYKERLKPEIEEMSRVDIAIEQKKNEKNPYNSLVEDLEKIHLSFFDKIVIIKESVQEKESLLPYYDFWIKGFSDDGIRSFIIEEILPILNDRIEYWLGVLTDDTIHLSFDRYLKEIIDEDSYSSLSGGQVSKCDLALSQAFSDINRISCGSCPSLLILDEVAANVDRNSINNVYQMIYELSKERQVFVITHNPDLQELLEQAEVLEVEKINKVSNYSWKN